VHNWPPRVTDALGITYEALAARNPRLIMTSITPYGLSGPRRDWEATDLTLWNAGGIAYLNGSPEAEELPPLAPFGHQAQYQGALTAPSQRWARCLRAARARPPHRGLIQESLAASGFTEYRPYMGQIARARPPADQLPDFLECQDDDLHLPGVESTSGRVVRDGSLRAGLDLRRRPSRGANWDALKPSEGVGAAEQRDGGVPTAQKRTFPSRRCRPWATRCL
jgi:hypothetical protein